MIRAALKFIIFTKKYKLLIIFVLSSIVLFGCQTKSIIPDFLSESKVSLPHFSSVPEVTISASDKIFFTRIGNSYDAYIDIPTEINGRIVAKAYNYRGDYAGHTDMFVIYGDKEFGPYGYSESKVIKFQDGIAFHAYKNNKSYIVTDKYEKQTPYNVHGSTLREVNGKIAFDAEKYVEQTGAIGTIYPRLIYDFEEIGEEYDSASNLIEADGKLYYEARKDGKSFIVVDGKPLETSFDCGNTSLSKSKDDIVYFGKRDSGYFLVIDQKMMGPFKGTSKLSEVSGKTAFRAAENNGEHYIYYDGEKYGPYDNPANKSIFFPFTEHDLYTMRKGNKTFVFVDGKEFGPFLNSSDDSYIFQKDNGQFYFTAKKEKSGSCYELYEASDGKKITDCPSNEAPRIIDGKIVATKYIYEDDSYGYPSGYELYVDGINISKKYENKYPSLKSLNFNGHLAFAAYTTYGSKGPLFILIDDKEYGPFPENSNVIPDKSTDRIFLEVKNKSGKKELYLGEIR